jgi:hypothetical protein
MEDILEPNNIEDLEEIFKFYNFLCENISYNCYEEIIKILYDLKKISIQYEIYDLISIQIQFKILSKVYECMISKRGNDYGFSIYNINDPHKFSDISLNKTIENDKYYLYNIYKIIFRVLENF